jgi:hypothetical protein
VLLHLLNPKPGEIIAPAANYAGDETVLNEIMDAEVSHIEIVGIDASETLLPGKARFVGSSLIKGRHIGIETSDYLDYSEAFLNPVRDQEGEIGGKAEPLAEPHPPGIGEPEEGGSVKMLKEFIVSASL